MSSSSPNALLKPGLVDVEEPPHIGVGPLKPHRRLTKKKNGGLRKTDQGLLSSSEVLLFDEGLHGPINPRLTGVFP